MIDIFSSVKISLFVLLCSTDLENHKRAAHSETMAAYAIQVKHFISIKNIFLNIFSNLSDFKFTNWFLKFGFQPWLVITLLKTTIYYCSLIFFLFHSVFCVKNCWINLFGFRFSVYFARRNTTVDKTTTCTLTKLTGSSSIRTGKICKRPPFIKSLPRILPINLF